MIIKRKLKRFSAIFLCFAMLFCTLNAFAVSQEKISNVLSDTASYLCKTVSSPTVASVGGEWAVIGLARSDCDVPTGYFDKYYKNVESYVKEKKGVLHERKYTEYSRVVIALCAIGKDPRNVAGYDLVTPVLDFDKTVYQGINGAIWALIALDCKEYGTYAQREKYVEYILSCEKADGGWALEKNATKADADITAMALTALSRHMENKNVNTAVERALEALSKMQNPNGSFSSYGEENSESTAWVLTALSTLSIQVHDKRFVKNGKTVIDSLLDFYKGNGSFAHTDSQNLMATEQAFYSLVAYQRMNDGKSTLFDMRNVKTQEITTVKQTDVKKQKVIYPTKTFSDIKNTKYKTAVEALARRGIVDGMTDNLFCPELNVTRAQFTAIVVRSLGLSEKSNIHYGDVSAKDWFYDSVAVAQNYGIIKGVSKNEFSPNGSITREQAAIMITRVARLCGMNTYVDEKETKQILSHYSDFASASDSALEALAFCCKNGIIDNNSSRLNPKKALTRGEVATMIYNMLGKADLL